MDGDGVSCELRAPICLAAVADGGGGQRKAPDHLQTYDLSGRQRDQF